MIRQFFEEDMDRVLSIWLEASAIAHDFVERAFWESRLSDMKEVYIPASDTYVYERNGEIEGFASLYEHVLAALFVAPHAQGTGIGRALMAHIKSLRSPIGVDVYKANERTISFYKASGFKVISERVDEHTGQPELVMVFCSNQFPE